LSGLTILMKRLTRTKTTNNKGNPQYVPALHTAGGPLFQRHIYGYGPHLFRKVELVGLAALCSRLGCAADTSACIGHNAATLYGGVA
jgi:hypothetical protein